MPVLDVSELNIVLGVLAAFILLYGIISIKIKAKWYLGEALPAVALGVILGPIAANFIDTERWGSASSGQTSAITLGLMRVMIGVQLVIVGFQLPAKYQQLRWKEMLLLLLPTMTIMWLATTLCILATVPKVTLLAALVIGSCVTCTDPILSQAIAKGPFADKYVSRDLREIISSEAGANDGFGFPFLMLATFLIRHADVPHAGEHQGETRHIFARGVAAVSEQSLRLVGRSEAEVGRLGGGVGLAMQNWFIETWFYQIFMSVAIGALVGLIAQVALRIALRKKWVDVESFLLYPTAMGLWLLSVCGLIGSDDLLSCFVAGNVLNWDGHFLQETLERHDEVNSVMDVLLNFGGFMYIGAIIPWSDFHSPETTGLTWGRLMGLGFLVLVFRRIPAVMLLRPLMPKVCKNWKEALFMGYFGPIGAGAVFYVEHTRHLFPEVGDGDGEEADLVRAMIPVVYFLVVFSIVVHGLSIPGLDIIYKMTGVQPIQVDAVEMRRRSVHVATPTNAVIADDDTFIAYNRFSRPIFDGSTDGLPGSRRPSGAGSQSRSMSQSRRMSASRSLSRVRNRPVSMDMQPDELPACISSESRDEIRRQLKEGRSIQYAV